MALEYCFRPGNVSESLPRAGTTAYEHRNIRLTKLKSTKKL